MLSKTRNDTSTSSFLHKGTASIISFTMTTFRSKYLRKQIAVPQDHGSWVFIITPLVIGFSLSGQFHTPAIYLLVAALAAFFIRQPVTMAVKAYAGRRPRTDLPAARFWMVVYGFVALLMLVGLGMRGYLDVVYLAVPGLGIFGWHLYLVSRRDERKQAGLEIVASGALALAAPAAYWIGRGTYEPLGWVLWLLVWLQSAASIVHAYMRLEHRNQAQIPERSAQLQIGKRALMYTSFNLLVSILLGFFSIIPAFLFVAYLPQWLESLWWTFHPDIKAKPVAIGARQTIVSTLYVVLFLIFWSF